MHKEKYQQGKAEQSKKKRPNWIIIFSAENKKKKKKKGKYGTEVLHEYPNKSRADVKGLFKQVGGVCQLTGC